MALIPTTAVPEDYRRKLAYKLMMEGTDASPVQHWAQGLARMGQGALGGYEMYRADEKDKASERESAQAYAALLGGGGLAAPQAAPVAPSAPPMPTPSRPLPPQSTPMASADPAPVAGPRPGGPVQPTAKVWGDAEAEAAGLYEPAPKNAKLASALAAPQTDPAALPPAAQPAQGFAVPGQAAPAADPRKAQIVRMLQSSNPAERKMGKAIADSLISQQFKPNEYDFKVVGDSLVRTDKKGDASLVPGISASKPHWTDTGEKDQNGNPVMGWVNPSDKSVTPYRPQSASAAPTITGPDGKPVTVQPGQDPKIIREAVSKRAADEAMPASGDASSKLRNEVQGLPSYKNIAQAAPVYKSMLEAAGRDTRAADVNMIYGMAKIMDPGSVVRESEMTVAQAIATLPQQLQATVASQLTSTGRLTPDVRAAIMQEAHSRIGAYQSMFDQDAGMYRGIAQRGRMNEADVLPTFGPYDMYKPVAPAAAGPKKTKSGVSWSVE